MLSSQKSTQSKILDFIKYHNGFVLGLVLALFGGAAIFAASPEAREAVLGKEIVSQFGIDNGALLAADLNNFDFQMKIENVGEDDGNYYVDYSFQTLGIQNNVWQTAPRLASMKIDKSSLAGEDLGLYVQKQLAQIAQNERDYLRQAQNAEIGKGLTRVVRTTEYTGLIGLVLDAKNAILPGYDPVVKPAPIELTQDLPQEMELLQERESVLIENADMTKEAISEKSPQEPEIITIESAQQNTTSTEEAISEAPLQEIMDEPARQNATTSEKTATDEPQSGAEAESAEQSQSDGGENKEGEPAPAAKD